MVNRPRHLNAYEFVVLSSLRAQQLMAGCLPRLEGQHKAITMAQMEVSEGRVTRVDGEAAKPEPGRATAQAASATEPGDPA